MVIGYHCECHSIGIYDLFLVSIVQFPSGAVATPLRSAPHTLSDVLLRPCDEIRKESISILSADFINFFLLQFVMCFDS